MNASQQLALLPYQNPLAQRLGLEFFRALPREPGIYIMRGRAGDILYVGKAKDLRARLNSYRLARPNTVSRKVLRLLRMVQAVELRLCRSEREALLTENKLLRELRPPFNVLNTNPEGYQYILLSVENPGTARFELTTHQALVNEAAAGTRVFGVFKGRRSTREGFASLLRLLSAVQTNDPDYYFPYPLRRDRPPPQFTLAVAGELMAPLREFLAGRSSRLVAILMERLLANTVIPRLVHPVLTADLKTLQEFYAIGPRRVRRLKRLHGIRRRPIAQEEIDDLLVLSI